MLNVDPVYGAFSSKEVTLVPSTPAFILLTKAFVGIPDTEALTSIPTLIADAEHVTVASPFVIVLPLTDTVE